MPSSLAAIISSCTCRLVVSDDDAAIGGGVTRTVRLDAALPPALHNSSLLPASSIDEKWPGAHIGRSTMVGLGMSSSIPRRRWCLSYRHGGTYMAI